MIGLFNIRKTRAVAREIANYMFILRTIDKHSSTEQWKECQLRTDMIGRIYTVINLREEDMGEMEEVKRFRVLEMMRPINVYLSDLGLQEIIIPNIEQVPDSRSYLITYTPLFSQFSYTWLSLNVVLPIGLILQFLLF